MSSQPRIVYCHCAYAQVVPADVKQQVLRELTDRDVSFEAVADLCEMAARRDPALARIAGAGPVRLAACYPRAVKWLFVSAGAPLPDDGVEIVNMRTATAEQASTALLRDSTALSPEPSAPDPDLRALSLEPSALHAEREVTS